MIRKIINGFVLAVFLMSACSLPAPQNPVVPSEVAATDISKPVTVLPTQTAKPILPSATSVPKATALTSAAEVVFEPADQPNTYWVSNPASQARMFVQVIYGPDWDQNPQPALVLVPGGVGTGGSLLEEARIFAAKGFSVVVFDPDGRGRSQGDENLNGFIHQDGLAAVVAFTQQLPEVQAGNVGLISFSYGVTMATGMLSRHPDSGVRFYIDWEGPVDRYDTTTTPLGECQVEASKQQWQPCDDEVFWSEREAITFMSDVKVPAYQRVQSEEDHVQPDVTHAVRMVNAAVDAGIGWVRLNDYTINRRYEENMPPKMFPEAMDKNRNKRIGDYAVELMKQFGW